MFSLLQCSNLNDKCNLMNYIRWLFTSVRGGGKCVCPRLSVCLSVCLLARLLKNAWIDLDEMLHVDRCRDICRRPSFSGYRLTYLVDEHSALPAPIAWKYLISNFPPSAAEHFRLPLHRSGTHYQTQSFRHQHCGHSSTN